MALVIFGVVLDLLIYKWRSLADVCLYHELVSQVIFWVFPTPANDHTDGNMFIVLFLTFICYSTDSRWQILAICIGFVFASTFL